MRRKTIFEYDSAFSTFLGFIAFVWAAALLFLPDTITTWARTKDDELFFHMIWRILGMLAAAALIPFGVWKTIQLQRSAAKYWSKLLFFLAVMGLVDVFRFTAKIIDHLAIDHSLGEPENLRRFAISAVFSVGFIISANFWKNSSIVRRAFFMQPRPANAPRPMFSKDEVGKAIRGAIGAGFLALLGVAAAAGAKVLVEDFIGGRGWNKTVAEVVAACPGPEQGSFLCYARDEYEIDEEGNVVETELIEPAEWRLLTVADGNFKVKNQPSGKSAMGLKASHFGEQTSEIQLYLPIEGWQTEAHYRKTKPNKSHNASLEEAGLRLRLLETGCSDENGQFEITEFVYDEDGELVGLGLDFEQWCTGGRHVFGRACIGCQGASTAPPPAAARGPRVKQAMVLSPPETRTIAPQLLNASCPRRGDAYACVQAGEGEVLTIGREAVVVSGMRVETSPELVEVEQREGTYKLSFESGEQRITIHLRSRRGKYPYPGLYQFGDSRSESPYLQVGLRPPTARNGRAENIEIGAFILHELEFNVYGRLQSFAASFEMRDTDFGPLTYGRFCYRCDGTVWNLPAAPPFDIAEPRTPDFDLTLDALDALCPSQRLGPYSWCLHSETKDVQSSDGQRVGVLQRDDFNFRTWPGGDQANSRGERISLATRSGIPGGGRSIVTASAPYKEKLQVAFYDDIAPLHGSPLRPSLEEPNGNTSPEGAFEIFHLRRNEAGEIIEIGIDFIRVSGEYATAGRVCYGCPQ